ncbi:MAG: amphi-Trp domain-containing protein [Anaerolineae bacterium]
MARKNVRFKSKEVRPTGEVAEFLHRLADKLEEGEVVLRRGDEVVKVTAPARLGFKLKVKEREKKRKTRHTFTLKLRWDGGSHGEPVTLD